MLNSQRNFEDRHQGIHGIMTENLVIFPARLQVCNRSVPRKLLCRIVSGVTPYHSTSIEVDRADYGWSRFLAYIFENATNRRSYALCIMEAVTHTIHEKKYLWKLIRCNALVIFHWLTVSRSCWSLSDRVFFFLLISWKNLARFL